MGLRLDRGGRHRDRAGEGLIGLQRRQLLRSRPRLGQGHVLGPPLGVGVHDHSQHPSRLGLVALLSHVQHRIAVLDGEIPVGLSPLRGGLGLRDRGVGDLRDEVMIGVVGGDALHDGVQPRSGPVGLVLDDAEAHGGGLVDLVQVGEHGHEDEGQDDGEAERPHEQDPVSQEPEYLIQEDGQHLRPPRLAGPAR